MSDDVHTGFIKFWNYRRMFGRVIVDGDPREVWIDRGGFASIHEANKVCALQRLAFRIDDKGSRVRAVEARVIE